MSSYKGIYPNKIINNKKKESNQNRRELWSIHPLFNDYGLNSKLKRRHTIQWKSCCYSIMNRKMQIRANTMFVVTNEWMHNLAIRLYLPLKSYIQLLFPFYAFFLTDSKKSCFILPISNQTIPKWLFVVFGSLFIDSTSTNDSIS